MLQRSLHNAFEYSLEKVGLWEQCPHVAVAVSGGADSLALLLLMQEWAETQQGSITALTVNHGLRAEAAKEAAYVAEICAARDIEHHTLTPNATPPEGNIQAWARVLRYDAMTEYCAAHGIVHLVVGHHADDQAETYVMRKQRGSVGGLASMALESSWNGVRLLRPLLQVQKATLQAFVLQAGIEPVQDPSNEDARYDRVKLRQQSEQEIVTDAMLAEAAALRIEQEKNIVQLLQNYVLLSPAGGAEIHSALLRQEDALLATACLLRVLRTIGNPQKEPRFANVQQLFLQLQQGQKKATLHGCVIEQDAEKDIVYIAPEKLQYPPAKPLAGIPWGCYVV